MKKLTKIYVIIGIISCFISSIISPPNSFPDENNHYYRVVTLADGKLFPYESCDKSNNLLWCNFQYTHSIKDSKSGYRVVSISKSHIEFMESGLRLKNLWSNKINIENSNTEFLYLCNTKYYLFTGYTIPAFVYYVVSSFTKNLYVRLLFTRFLTGLFFLGVIALCIQKVKRYSLVVFLVASLPMTSYLLNSLAPDGLLISLSLLLLVLLINILEINESFTFSNKLMLFICTFLLSCTKPGYFFLGSAIWLLTFKDKRWTLFSICISFLSVLTFISLYYTLGQIYPTPIIPEISDISQYSVTELLGDPVLLIKRLTKFITQDSSIVGKEIIFYFTKFFLPTKIYYVYLLVIFFTLSYQEDEPNWEFVARQKIIIFVLVFLGIGFILFAFLMIKEKECMGICGVQGRYFIPYLPLLFLLIHTFIKYKILTNKIAFNISVVGIVLLSLFANAYLFFLFYYFWN